MSKDTSTGFFAGLIIGAVIGVAVGILYAPKSGNETRRLVKEKAAAAKDTLTQTARRVKDTVSSRINSDSDSL